MNHWMYLNTHVANIALNKSLGLRFLLAEPQSSIQWSVDSMIGSQLLVAASIAESFFGSNDSRLDFSPVAELFFDPERSCNPDPLKVSSFGIFLTRFKEQYESVKSELWLGRRGPEVDPLEIVLFLEKLLRQARECAKYMGCRAETIFVAFQTNNALVGLTVKNSLTAEREFCINFLVFMREVLVEEAKLRGYGFDI